MRKITRQLADLMNYLSALCIMAMMMLTCADVLLRLFKHPILGTYELVGLFGALTIALAIPATTLSKGHVAVDFLIDKLPLSARKICTIITTLLSISLFALIAWQSFIYANILRSTGEVTLSLQMPFYPIVYAIAAAALLVCVVLFLELATPWQKAS
ncbi:MAG: TRAP transporter small permease [Deltaproteobacteria bacterium]|nr:TRAP transporter small permease [Candidatus Tharpellaceae bacterium]